MLNSNVIRVAAGLLISLLAAVVITGWFTHQALLVQIRPQFVAMVLNTALCFLLFGLSFLLPARHPRTPVLRSIAGLAVIAISLPVLLVTLGGPDLGTDWRPIHAWLTDGNPNSGRMAPNTTFGFLLGGLVLVLAGHVRTRAAGWLVQVATFAVLLLGLTGLVGYSLQLELLYSWFQAARMAVHTAVGMTLVGLGLWATWSGAAWYGDRRIFRDDERIAFVGAALLVVVALTAGVAGFAAQQATLEKSLEEALPLALRTQRSVFESEISHTYENATNTATRPNLIRIVRESAARPDDARLASDIGILARSVVATGITGLAIRDRTGRELIRLGSFSAQPEIAVPLQTGSPSTLLWQGRMLLRTEVDVVHQGVVVGSVSVEEPMPLASQQLMHSDGLGDTGEAGLCAPDESGLLCFPQHRNSQVYRVARVGATGKPIPMSLAVDGGSGLFKGQDYRGQLVIAAYGPLPDSNLGMVVKKDAEELFLPIRQQLEWSLPILLVLVAAGALMLRGQVRPLATRLLVSEADAIEKELRIRTVVESVADGIVTIDESSRIESFNGAASALFGYTAEEIVGRSLHVLMPEPLRDLHDAGMSRYLAGGEPRVVGKQVELRALRRDGSTFPMELSVNALVLNGRRSFVGIVRDISERKRAEAAVFGEKERLRVTLASIGDGVITTDTTGNVTYLNAVAEEMTGWSNEEAQGLPLLTVFNIVHEHTDAAALNPIELVLRDDAAAGLAEHTILVQRGGARFPVEDSAAPIRDINGLLIGAVLVFHDVSQARLMATEMTFQATHDALTGLINRREFERRLELAVQSGKLEGRQHSMLYMDLDQFKIVNDTCGHAAGDELLRQLTALMLEKLRRSDTLARLGGDEFAALLENCPTEPARRIAEELRKTVSEFHFVWGDRSFPIGVSIGLVAFSNGGITAADVLRDSDAACYVAKDKGRNRIHVFAEEDAALAQRAGEMGWVGRIKRCLEEGRFELYSQKLLPLSAGHDAGTHYEVLLRMRDEQGKLVPPMAFIPAAERYGLMPSLDRWVVATAMHDCAARMARGERIGTCAINLSGTSICDDELLPFVLQQLKQDGVDAGIICFEITETAAITNLAHAAVLIRELRAHGFRFALDDFGSGMSSFSYLKHLPVDYLKIDGSFVKDMLADPTDCAMVEAINHIGHVMGIETIAEFVESDAVLAKLRAIGVDYAQGYGIEKPHPLIPAPEGATSSSR